MSNYPEVKNHWTRFCRKPGDSRPWLRATEATGLLRSWQHCFLKLADVAGSFARNRLHPTTHRFTVIITFSSTVEFKKWG